MKWEEDYIELLFEKYKSVPNDLKYNIIRKDYKNMYGTRGAEDFMRYMYDTTDSFIISFDNAISYLSKTVIKNIIKKYWADLALNEHCGLVSSGMFYGFFPQLTGIWQKDKDLFFNFIAEREKNKEYYNILLNENS